MEQVRHSEIEHCLEMVAQEETKARRASSPEAAELHFQMASLYKAQLELLKTARV